MFDIVHGFWRVIEKKKPDPLALYNAINSIASTFIAHYQVDPLIYLQNAVESLRVAIAEGEKLREHGAGQDES